WKSIIREYEVDTVYLLAKELAYDVVTGQTDNLAAALAKTSGKDIVQFAKAVGVSHPNIDGKVCVTKDGNTQKSSYGVYDLATATDKNAKSNAEGGHTSLCGDKGGSSAQKGGTTPEVFKHFVEKTLKDGSKNWPTSSKESGVTSDDKNDNAKAVAGDLTKLSSEEKTIVAGLLAKTIEGGEVVEIRAVSSTSVMVNSSGYAESHHMM
ncbi:P44-67 outer membrane protein, partial [Anaplasma phagocytophilum str. HGE1]